MFYRESMLQTTEATKNHLLSTFITDPKTNVNYLVLQMCFKLPRHCFYQDFHDAIKFTF